MPILYCAIDNGTTGSIAMLQDDGGVVEYCKTPVFKQQDFTKEAKNVTRVNGPVLLELFRQHIKTKPGMEWRVFMERPFVNPKMFNATLSAIRAWETTLTIIELLDLHRQTKDSRTWQSRILPKGIKGTPDLKRASVDIGCKLFPTYTAEIVKHGDADSLLMCEVCRREKW